MTAETDDPFAWRPLLVCWVMVLALIYLAQIMGGAFQHPFTDNDDVMRLVTATDLAHGQFWQDQVEHRDNAPFGSPMHWSRLVDAPIAALIVVLQPVLGAAAGSWAGLVWPPLLLLALLAVSAGLTRRLLGPGHRLAALLLPAISLVVLTEFRPFRVDHHNVQMILTTTLVWATLSGRTRPLAAIVAGLLAATSLAIGIETLPFLAGAGLAFALYWVLDPGAAGNFRRFALALALGTGAHFLLATAPAHYFVAACDELSATYVVATVLGAAAVLLATGIGSALGANRRLLLMGLLGVLAAALTLVLFPDCRAGPYGHLDPRAFDLLLAHVPEAQPLWARFAADPVTGLSFALTPSLGIAVLFWCSLTNRGAARLDWLVLLLFLVLATIVMLLQVRGVRLAVMPAIPAGAWLIGKAREAFARRRDVLRAGVLAASWLGFTGLAQVLLPAAVAALAEGAPAVAAARPSLDSCFTPSAYARLAGLPVGNVVAPMLLGAHILAHSADSVVAAGYHRNVAGAIDADDFLNAGETPARAIATRRSLRYVVACRGLPELTPRPSSTPDSFVALWTAGQHWTWLTPLSEPAEPLQIFRIEPVP